MTERPIINVTRVHIITQNGAPYRAYTDYDFACDYYHMLETEFPWFKWKLVTTSVNPTVARIQSGA